MGESRAERAAEALRLRMDGGDGEGLSIGAIAREMGISISYASELIADPTGEIARARKRKYLKRCKVCNQLCYGVHCADHTPVSSRQHWTEEMIVEAIQEWHVMYGRPPILKEWSRRKNMPGWAPTVTIVYKIFGKNGWNKAIAAAGFKPRPAEPPDYAKQANNVEWTEERRKAWGERMSKMYAENPDNPQFVGLRLGQELERPKYLRRLREMNRNQDADE